MSINLTDELDVKTKKGKLGAARQMYLDGDTKNLQQAYEETNTHFGTLDTRSSQMEKAIQDISVTGGASTANAVSYDNTISELEAVNTQGAIDEVSRISHFAKRGSPINISTNYNSLNTAEILTLSQAINKVPSKDRVLRFQGTYLASNGWHTIIYTGDNLSTWANSTKWIDLTDSIFNSISENATFAGIATLTTNPGTPDGPVFYFANSKGIYPNFGGLEVTEDEVIILYWDSKWNKVSTGIASNAKLTDLEIDLQSIRGNWLESFSPTKSSGKRIIYFNIVKGETYDIAINLSAAEPDIVYLGINTHDNQNIVRFKVEKGHTLSKHSFVFNADYKGAFLYVSYYHEPVSKQVSVSMSTGLSPKNLKVSIENSESILKKIQKDIIVADTVIDKRSEILPIIESISLVKGHVYQIKYQSNGGVFSDCALRIRHNDTDLWKVEPNNLESAEYSFTPDKDYDDAIVAFIAYGGGESYGESISISFNIITSLTKDIVKLKSDVTEMLPLLNILGYNSTYAAYTPIHGGGQILGFLNLTKGCPYRVQIKLSKSESDIVYCGIKSSEDEALVSAVQIRSGELEKTFTIIPEQNYGKAKIYVSFYHDPEEEQSVIASVKVDNIYDLINKGETVINYLSSFEFRTKEQMALASHLGFGREATWTGDYMPTGWIPQLVFLHISDTHQNKACSKNAITALNLLSTGDINKGNNARFLIHTGDIKTENYLSDFTYWQNERAKANKPVFHVIGNHDCGLNTEVATSGTDEQVFASNIEPYLSEWNLTTPNGGTPHINGKSYYFKDFLEEKIRLIVIYEYETDFELDTNNTTRLKYHRAFRAFRQSQIDWIIDSLLTTPSGWGVMIAKHQMEYADNNDNPFNSYFLRGNSAQSTYVGNILPDIIQAFMDKSKINKSYQQTGGVVTTLNAEADFSNSGAEFICYLSGHTHLDSIHYLRDYPKQLELTIGCDNTNYTHGSDMAQIAGTKTEDVINVCSVDRNRGYIYVVRIGADMSYTCQRRDILAIKYRNSVSL